ncbi:MAG: DUF932 domain-containing protein [bacterium]
MNEKTLKLIEAINAYDALKWDEVAPANSINYGPLHFWYKGRHIDVTDTAARQLCVLNGIPPAFFMDTMRWDEKMSVFNRLNEERGDTEHMFRFSGDTLYGVVSPKYRRIDNSRMLSILETAADSGLPLMPVKYKLDTDHSRIVLVPEHAQVGELTPSLTITNSECGLASLNLWAGVYRWVCTNGLMVPVGDIARSRWFHIGNAAISLPDICIVLNRSVEYVQLLYEARSRYLRPEDKVRILNNVSEVLGQRVAEKVSDVANAEYSGAPTLYHAVNAITRTAQMFRPQVQSDVERFAGRLLAA